MSFPSNIEREAALKAETERLNKARKEQKKAEKEKKRREYEERLAAQKEESERDKIPTEGEDVRGEQLMLPHRYAAE